MGRDATRGFAVRNQSQFSSQTEIVSLERLPPQATADDKHVSIPTCDMPETNGQTVLGSSRSIRS
jgi:hypothetical protein